MIRGFGFLMRRKASPSNQCMRLSVFLPLSLAPVNFFEAPISLPTCHFFMWVLWWDRTPTVDNLIARGFVTPNWCYMCMSNGESSGHLFLHCSRVAALWEFFIVRVGVPQVHLASLIDRFHCQLSQPPLGWNMLGKEIWGMIPAAICWSIWKEQNRRIFEGSSAPDWILSSLYDWLSFASSGVRPSYESWMFDWDSFILMPQWCFFFLFSILCVVSFSLVACQLPGACLTLPCFFLFAL